MANYATLKAAIAAAIKENGNKEITGNLLQQQLLAMVNSLGVGYQYVGIAIPTTNPGTPDQNVFYLAWNTGTYANFSNIIIAENEIAILKWNGTWVKETTGAATVTELKKMVVRSLGKNLFNKNGDLTIGYYLSPIDGSRSANESYDISEFIAVLPNTVYHLSRAGNNDVGSSGSGIHYYDDNKQFISASALGATSFMTPENAKYVRFSLIADYLSEEIQFELGSERTDYEEYTDIYDKPVNKLIPETVNTGAIANGAVTTQKIADGAVTREKLDENAISGFLVPNSKNIIDWDNVNFIVNQYYKGSTGALAGGTGVRVYMAIPLIKIEPNTTYNLSCLRGGEMSGIGASTEVAICFYSGNQSLTGDFIGSVSGATQSFTTPANAEYIGISVYNFDSLTKPYFGVGAVREYTDYNPLSGYNVDGAIKDGSIDSDKIAIGGVLEKNTVFFEMGKNLFNKATVTRGYYIGPTGAPATNPSWAYSDYIPVDPSKEYIVANVYGTGGAYNAFYDSNKAFISNFREMPVEIPGNAAFVRISLNYNGDETFFDSVQLEYGEIQTQYEAYGYKLKQNYIPSGSDGEEKQKFVLPKKLYVPTGVNFDIFYQPILRFWDPNKYDVMAYTSPTGRDYKKAIKRVCTINTNENNPSSINLQLYDAYAEKVVLSKSVNIVKGNSGVGPTQVKIGIMGDSYTDGGCFTPTLLNPALVPNLKMVGTRSVNNEEYINQCLDGRAGWTLRSFFAIQTGSDYFNPFYHPSGSHRYWGNTAFWANVCGGSPSGYGTRYTHYSNLCDSTGWPVSPINGDVIFDSANGVFMEYQNGTWTQIATSVAEIRELYTWSFDYAKYLSMWSVEMADIFCVYLGVNDYWINSEPTDLSLLEWGQLLDAVEASFHSVNANGKFVVLGPNTVTYPNVNHYKPLDVHRRMFKLREFIIDNYDDRESENIFVVDTAHLVDCENSYTLVSINPFDGYPNGYGYANKETYCGDGQHPRVGYTILGYGLAGFIQNVR